MAELAHAACSELLDMDAFSAIRGRMEEYDKQRENVIKQSRDVQKLSKQAIFSVQRGQIAAAETKLTQARTLAETIGQIIQQHPTLRAGAYSNSLEVSCCRCPWPRLSTQLVFEPLGGMCL